MASSKVPETEFKKSNATKLWLAVLVVVLAILFFETSITKQTGYNVVLITDSNFVDAAVYVDNKVKGKVEEASNLGGNSGTICLDLKSGEHTLELKKGQKVLARKKITVKGKSLINFKNPKSPDNTLDTAEKEPVAK